MMRLTLLLISKSASSNPSDLSQPLQRMPKRVDVHVTYLTFTFILIPYNLPTNSKLLQRFQILLGALLLMAESNAHF